MARSYLTLAALATSAVPGLDVAGVAPFGSPEGSEFDAALLTGRDGRHWIIRAPRNDTAEAEQSADLVALNALSTGIRTRLPFAVSTFAGETALGRTRAVVYEFVYGGKVPLSDYGMGPNTVATSAGAAIAAIHSLPTGFVADAGLPVLTAGDCLRATITVVERAAATGLLPAALKSRWEAALEESKLWQFQPTVVNGALTAESILSADDRVTGVLGWQELKVGDPARDLQWLLTNTSASESAIDAYTSDRDAPDRHVQQRATLYAELELAKWLLHGTHTRSTDIVDDAVELLTNLVDNIRNDVMNPIGTQTMPTMAIDEVEAFLDRNQRVV